MKPAQSFWLDKRVLLTGHSGFKGSWLALWLTMLGARVTGVSLPPVTTPDLGSLIKLDERVESKYLDIRNAAQLAEIVQKTSPEIVFHLAAQPLVRASYRKPLETFSTNIMGTAHLLDSLRELRSVRVVLCITTDKVYKNREWVYPYRENDELGGHDPYSASKAASEIVIAAYKKSFLEIQSVALATARAGNVIGGGDWSEDRLIPDAVRAWDNNTPLHIRSPFSIRPWQHVLEPLAGYLLLAEKLWHNKDLAGAYNFGPETNNSATVKDVIRYAQKCYGTGVVTFDENPPDLHEANSLSLDISKTKTVLGLTSKWSLNESIASTINWYKQVSWGKNPATLCISEIEKYEALL